ncbi:poly(A) RNA polymerase, mitochondrial isoform X2 [Octopus bimaculoides]|uniref:Poly(A) RNA polymerase, mitochondrial n=1 Tax=Octopus bimaculoides TaxID=37653 RepID=A0A0L8H5V0_OCTBM|nr:poly(A) RNA polymerase, mitochondrial isoform X2 [Octopus bimaculoides]|eukprot:XP_014775237.1 PREDICTED: poly(A) RNA polymerase, mitochondrial-like [Octopus bimaculoides]
MASIMMSSVTKFARPIRNYSYSAPRIKEGSKSSSFNSYRKSFSQLCIERKAEAHRSILVKLNNKEESNYVYHYCQQFGKIANAMHFQNVKNYVLIEFKKQSCIPNLLSSVSHFQNDKKIPAETRLLCLPSQFSKKKTEIPSGSSLVRSIEETPLLLSDLAAVDSMTEQMEMLYQHLQLTDLGQRLRFFICSTLEDMLKSLFPHCHVYPFGSSVNGFGRNSCDLDMILNLCTSKSQENTNNRLKFLTKLKHDEEERSFSCRNLKVFAEMIENFIPSCVRINPILRARVPIIKFYHEACDIECDLSLQDTSGVTMSNVMYMLGVMDRRVCPLVFTVRHWAKVNNISHQHPGPWLSNFMLSLLVICFLQLRAKPILPSFSSILNAKENAQPTDVTTVDDETLVGDLLIEFFNFYSVFDFKQHALSPLHGKCFLKPDYSALYIENPLDIELNIAKNVSNREMMKLTETFKTTLWHLNNSGMSLVNIFLTEDSKRVLKKKFNVHDLYR